MIGAFYPARIGFRDNESCGRILLLTSRDDSCLTGFITHVAVFVKHILNFDLGQHKRR